MKEIFKGIYLKVSRRVPTKVLLCNKGITHILQIIKEGK